MTVNTYIYPITCFFKRFAVIAENMWKLYSCANGCSNLLNLYCNLNLLKNFMTYCWRCFPKFSFCESRLRFFGVFWPTVLSLLSGILWVAAHFRAVGIQFWFNALYCENLKIFFIDSKIILRFCCVIPKLN